MDLDSGIRQIQTFKKLPMHAPVINAMIRIGAGGIYFTFGMNLAVYRIGLYVSSNKVPLSAFDLYYS